MRERREERGEEVREKGGERRIGEREKGGERRIGEREKRKREEREKGREGKATR